MENNIYYFAYGSNMDPVRMYGRRIDFTSRIAAYLPGYELKFNKRSTYNENETYANIMPKHKANTLGILYKTNEHSMRRLDRYEGVRYAQYFRKKVSVYTDDGIVDAICYVANNDFLLDNTPPSQTYVSHLLKGTDLWGEKLKMEVLKAQLILN